MKITCRALTHRGVVRRRNEDAILVEGWVRAAPMGAAREFCFDGPPFLAAVADGLGGHNRGDIASTLALSRLAVLEGLAVPDEGSLGSALETVHEELTELASSSAEFRGMATTIAGIALLEDRALLFNAGDSRIYRREGEHLQRLSVDDRPACVGAGEDAMDQATNVVLQCLGGERGPQQLVPHFMSVDLAEHETFLLCTDGLHDVVNLHDMEAALLDAEADPQADPVLALLNRALEAGAPDNVTILLVRIENTPGDPETTLPRSPES